MQQLNQMVKEQRSIMESHSDMQETTCTLTTPPKHHTNQVGVHEVQPAVDAPSCAACNSSALL
jgi:hypothetical protein